MSLPSRSHFPSIFYFLCFFRLRFLARVSAAPSLMRACKPALLAPIEAPRSFESGRGTERCARLFFESRGKEKRDGNRSFVVHGRAPFDAEDRIHLSSCSPRLVAFARRSRPSSKPNREHARESRGLCIRQHARNAPDTRKNSTNSLLLPLSPQLLRQRRASFAALAACRCRRLSWRRRLPSFFPVPVLVLLLLVRVLRWVPARRRRRGR